MAVNSDEMTDLIINGYIFSPVFEDVLKGKYVAVFPDSNIEKPLIDLKAIAEYNKKYSEKPLNFFEQLQTSITGIFCHKMKNAGFSKLDKPFVLTENVNGEIVKTIIKYKPEPEIDLEKKKSKIFLPNNYKD